MSEKWGLIRPSCPIFADFFEPKWVERRQAEHGPKVGRYGSDEVRFLSRGWYEGMLWKLGDRMRGLSEQRSRSVWVVQLYVNAGGAGPFPSSDGDNMHRVSALTRSSKTEAHTRRSGQVNLLWVVNMLLSPAHPSILDTNFFTMPSKIGQSEQAMYLSTNKPSS